MIGLERVPIEVSVEADVGFNIEKNAGGNVIYRILRVVYIFEENKPVSSKILTGVAGTIGEIRENRAKRLDKKEVRGQEKCYILSEEVVSDGVKPIVDAC